MTQKKDKKIKLANKNSVRFPNPETYGNILLIGNFDSVCGTLHPSENGKKFFFDEFSDALRHNASILVKILQAGKHIYLISTKETDLYFRRLLTCFKDMGAFGKVSKNKIIKQYHWQELDCNKTDSEMTDCLNNKLYNSLNEMKFDVVIQNPPYNGSLHLDFLEKGLDVLTETGKMVIIEPATWLINVRKNGKAKRYDAIKQRINGHIESVVIENLNKEFNVENNEPFAITTIDMSKEFKTIKYECFGVSTTINSVYDCNLIGDYNIIWSIFEKVQSYGEMLKAHITKKPINDDSIWYGKISRVGRCGCKSGNRYHLDSFYYGNIFKYYYYNGLDDRDEISKTYHKSRGFNGEKTDKDADFCIFGTQTELENWKYFIYNNKLSLFLLLVLSINQDNNSREFLPWLVDKQYTDDEINKLFGFTDEEIKLIDITIKKYERNSPWFKRYMCGKDAVTDEEVNNFIAEISK